MAQTGLSADTFIESTSGGFRFPDGTEQSTAAPTVAEATPLQAFGTCTLNDGDFSTPVTSIYTVPSGQRLEIEYVNLVAINLGASEVLLPLIITTGGGLGSRDFYLEEIDGSECTAYPAFPDTRCLGSGLTLRIHADPDTEVSCRTYSTTNVGNTRTLAMAITGRLVDVAP
jgi:hypothetical protein